MKFVCSSEFGLVVDLDLNELGDNEWAAQTHLQGAVSPCWRQHAENIHQALGYRIHHPDKFCGSPDCPASKPSLMIPGFLRRIYARPEKVISLQ